MHAASDSESAPLPINFLPIGLASSSDPRARILRATPAGKVHLNSIYRWLGISHRGCGRSQLFELCRDAICHLRSLGIVLKHAEILRRICAHFDDLFHVVKC
jgi:hypothetical protein